MPTRSYADVILGGFNNVGQAIDANRERADQKQRWSDQLGFQQQEYGYRQTRDAAEDAWRRQEAERAQRNADRTYGLQAQAAQRAAAAASRPDIREFYTNDGRKTYGYVDPSAPGGFRQIGGAAQAGNFAQPMTDPRLRAQWGIPEDDTRPYAMTENGPKLIGGTGVTVNTGDSGYDRTLGTENAKSYVDLNASARGAQSTLDSLSVMERAMQDPNFYSGTASGPVLALKRGYVALGGDPNETASTEVFQAQGRKAALDAMGGSLGAGFSNADREFVVGQVPNLDNTPEGNRQIITINRAIAQRQMQIAQRAREYALRNGRFDEGFWQELHDWAEANPVFPNNDRLPRAPATASAAPAAAAPAPDGEGWIDVGDGIRMRERP